MAKPYGDIGKEARDVLSQDFLNDGTFRITHSAKTRDNLNVKTTFTRTNKGKEEVIAVIEPKFDLSPNVEANIKFSTNKDVTAGLVAKNLGLVDGLKLEGSATHSEKEGLTLNTNVSWQNPNFNLKVTVAAPLASQKYKLTEEAAWKLNSQSVIGVKGVYGVSDGSIDLNPILSHTQGDHIFTLSTPYSVATKKSSVSLTTHSKLSPKTKVATDTKYEVNPAKNGELFTSTVGFEHKLHAKTSLKIKGKGSVFANSNKDARINIGLKHSISPSTTVMVGVDVGLTGVLGFGPSTTSFGIAFQIDS